MYKLISLLFLIANVVYALSAPFTDCASTKLVPKTVTLLPDPPVAGQKLIVTVSGHSEEYVSSGLVDIKVIFGKVPLYSTEVKICDVTQCPIADNNDFDISYSVDLPIFTPKGDYTVDVSVKNQNEDQVTCLSVGAHITSVIGDHLR